VFTHHFFFFFSVHQVGEADRDTFWKIDSPKYQKKKKKKKIITGLTNFDSKIIGGSTATIIQIPDKAKKRIIVLTKNPEVKDIFFLLP
jgi:hypothetical protein